MNVSIEYLREALLYDPKTGVFVWKERPREHFSTDIGWKATNKNYAGKVAGTLSKDKRRDNAINLRIMVDGKAYIAGVLAWAYVNRRWPLKQIDHINGNQLDNRIENLREASNMENCCNKKARKDNILGVKGVSIHGKSNKYIAQIQVKNKKIHIGLFNTIEEASEAYKEMARKHHGEFAKF